MRYWSLLFLAITVFVTGCFVYAPFSPDWWLPNNGDHVISTFGKDIDSLYVIILWITGIAYVGTQAVMVYVAWKFADERDAEGRPKRRATYVHGSHRLEVIWTIIPAAILAFIALYQMGLWAQIKFRSMAPKVPVLAEVTARQFQWVIRYPGPDGRLNSPSHPSKDDLVLVNDLHFVKGKEALIYLKSSDVIHSFFLPQMRIKQDAVPGITIPVWFDSDTAGEYDLACAELCGWGHYKMRGRVTVHETEADFQKWADEQVAEQGRDQLTMATDK